MRNRHLQNPGMYYLNDATNEPEQKRYIVFIYMSVECNVKQTGKATSRR